MAYTITSPVGQIWAGLLEPFRLTDHLKMWLNAAGGMFDPVYSIVAEQGSDGDPGYVPGYGALFDVTQCPTVDLPYLAQFVGVTLPIGASDPFSRSLISAEAGMARGTLASIRSAVQRSISTMWQPNTAYLAGVMVRYDAGAGDVYYLVTTSFTSGATFATTDLAVVDPTTQYSIHENTNAAGAQDAYAISIVTKPEQLTPVSNTTALTTAVNAVKPGGVLLGGGVISTDSPIWSAATKTWSASGLPPGLNITPSTGILTGTPQSIGGNSRMRSNHISVTWGSVSSGQV